MQSLDVNELGWVKAMYHRETYVATVWFFFINDINKKDEAKLYL
jgi:hypothetical protein